MNMLVLCTSFCVISVVNAGLLGLSIDERQQHVIDLSSVTSALTGGLQKVLDVIRNPKPVTIEIYSQEQSSPNDQFFGGNPPYGFQPPGDPHHQHHPPPPPHHHPHHPPPAHHHPHHPPPPPPYQGHRPPFPPGGGYPPNYPYNEMENYYPDGVDRPNQNNYPDGSWENTQQYGHDINQQNGDSERQDESGGQGSQPQDAGELNKRDETGIDGYIDGFPVILLDENEIR